MKSSLLSETEQLATALAEGAALELYLTPKPGLVDLADSGSHPDLPLSTMECSLQIITDYLSNLLCSLKAGESFDTQVCIAKRTEQTMQQVLGTNTHKGYFFLSGMLLIARWHSPSPHEHSLRSSISLLAGEFFDAGGERTTNGGQARDRFRAGGIVREALDGFPALFDVALPAYRTAIAQGCCFRRASFAMMARLMQTVEDTTTLHRGGALGLSRIRRDGHELERILMQQEDCFPFLTQLNHDYIRMNLTMGGVADMLGLSYGYLIAQRDIVIKPATLKSQFQQLIGSAGSSSFEKIEPTTCIQL
jgi:triphosphoribosyl-dephospho-CoA synthetase